jgi:ribonuclease D
MLFSVDRGAPDQAVVTDTRKVEELAERVEESGVCALDLEFVSEARYVPELGLVQLAFGEGDSQYACAVDPARADLGALFRLLSSDRVRVVAHAARQDLSLLAARFDVRVRRLCDTQIAAAFAGLGEQIGYARLVRHLLGVELDKGPQWTDWTQRPLTAAQIRYALDDVRYLLPTWDKLVADLDKRGRVDWVREESERLSHQAAERTPANQVYRHVGGWNALKGAPLGSLRALAAWREEEARRLNKPPSWLLPDVALVDLCRRQAVSDRDLKRARGVGVATVRRYGEAIVAAIAAGASEPLEARGQQPTLSARGQAWVGVIVGLIQARCQAADLPARFAGSRSDAEDLVRYAETEMAADKVALLAGWRRAVVGEEALSWLRGEIALAVDGTSTGGLRAIDIRKA